ncbi:MAG TPA: M15 family metallopeptidase [Microthrixaceae bacterium]|nr:M15 family metallopeptidase [Microthrixaceae bacterium]
MVLPFHDALLDATFASNPDMNRRTPRTAARILAVSLALSLSLTPLSIAGPSAAADSGSARQKLKELQSAQEKLRAEKSKSASNVNALQATEADVQASLASLRANVESEASLLEDSRRAVTAAEAREQEALAQEATAAAELEQLNADIKEQVRLAFIAGSSVPDDPIEYLAEDSLTEASRKRVFRNANATSGADAAEHYRTIQNDLRIAREAAAAASAEATAKRAEVETRLAKLQDAQAAQEAYADQVADRIANAYAEAAGLEALEPALAEQIKGQQQALDSALASEREAAAARARAAGARTTSGRPSGSGGSVSPVGEGSIVAVGGIRVHRDIADSLAALLNAAAADGIHLSGGGYRDSAGQIATRRNNCGTSNYAIYEMPSSSCRPPTARPGSSMHERGLAIDFSQNGRVLNRGSSAFSWLKANAANYGFYNLPSEPWHWSTNGN